MEIEIYGKAGCEKCDTAKKIIGENMGLNYTYRDMETPEGVTEYCMKGFDAKFNMEYPVITVDEEGFGIIGKAIKAIKEKMGSGS